jgi:peptidoglycan/LPS O-acetylase OafA/YrhL
MTSVNPADTTTAKSTRLHGVDGLRAIAALWVVLFHMSAFSGEWFHGVVPGLDLFLRSGSTGVSLFLVLSGFCLFLPFAGGRAERFRAWEFFRRRCKRLMPAYLVALAVAVGLAVAFSGRLGYPVMTTDDVAWQTFTHVTLIHTLFPGTFYSLNGAFWSLGLEWQLYLALPLLILIVKRFGLAPAIALALLCNVVYRLGLGLAIDAGAVDGDSLMGISVLPNQLPGRWAEFAFGMLAAELYASGRLRKWSRYYPALLVAILALIPASVVASRFQLGHMVYGVLFFALLTVVVMGDNFVGRMLSWRPLVILGTMSYSLYLVHQPLIQLQSDWLYYNQPGLAPGMVYLALVASLPLILVVAWVLFVTVERHTAGPDAARLLLPKGLRVSWRTATLAARRAVGE